MNGTLPICKEFFNTTANAMGFNKFNPSYEPAKI